jgi:hypothetical protein
MSEQVISYRKDSFTGAPIVELWGRFQLADLVKVVHELEKQAGITHEEQSEDEGPTGTCSLGFDLRS